MRPAGPETLDLRDMQGLLARGYGGLPEATYLVCPWMRRPRPGGRCASWPAG